MDNVTKAVNKIEATSVALRCEVAEGRAARIAPASLERIKLRHLNTLSCCAAVISAESQDSALRAENAILLAQVQAELSKTTERLARLTSYDRTILDGNLADEFDEDTTVTMRTIVQEGGPL